MDPYSEETTEISILQKGGWAAFNTAASAIRVGKGRYETPTTIYRILLRLKFLKPQYYSTLYQRFPTGLCSVRYPTAEAQERAMRDMVRSINKGSILSRKDLDAIPIEPIVASIAQLAEHVNLADPLIRPFLLQARQQERDMERHGGHLLTLLISPCGDSSSGSSLLFTILVERTAYALETLVGFFAGTLRPVVQSDMDHVAKELASILHPSEPSMDGVVSTLGEASHDLVAQNQKILATARDYISRKVCGSCGQEEPETESFKRCGSCGVVYYCSTDCQGEHWRVTGHKKMCRPLRFIKLWLSILLDGDTMKDISLRA